MERFMIAGRGEEGFQLPPEEPFVEGALTAPLLPTPQDSAAIQGNFISA